MVFTDFCLKFSALSLAQHFRGQEGEAESMAIKVGKDMARWLGKFYRDDCGASAAEYVILVGCIAIAIIAVVAILGGLVEGLYVKGNGIFNK